MSTPNQVLINFDDITLSGVTESVLPANYQELQWSNGYVVKASAYPTDGYTTVLRSSPNVGFNGYKNPIEITRSGGQRFTVNSFYIAAAFESSVTMTFTGYLSNAQVYSTTYIISKTSATLVTLNWANMDRFTFSPSPAAYFAIDDLYVTLVQQSLAD